MTEGMLGRNNETMREKGWRTDEGSTPTAAWFRPPLQEQFLRLLSSNDEGKTAAEESETGNMGGVRRGVDDEPHFKRRSVRRGRSPSPGPDVGAAAC